MVSFLFIFGLCETSIQFLQQINVKKVHPVHGAGILIPNRQNMSLMP